MVYLSIRLSHQQGTIIKVIPFLVASSCFTLSLSRISSNDLFEVAVSLR